MSTRAHIMRWLGAWVGMAGLNFDCRVLAAAPSGEVVILGAEGWRNPPRELFVFSGRATTCEVLLPPATDRSRLWVELFAIAGGMVLPLGAAQPIEVPRSRSPDALPAITSVPVTFPNVERRTAVLIRFTTDETPRRVLGAGRAQVYPPIDWAPLARQLRANGKRPRLLVFGPGENLREFLRDRDVPFTDQGAGRPAKLEPDMLALGAQSAAAWAEDGHFLSNDGGHLIVWVDDPLTPPGVYSKITGLGMVTRVTLPVPESASSDPRGEELFYQLIQQHLPAVTGDIR